MLRLLLSLLVLLTICGLTFFTQNVLGGSIMIQNIANITTIMGFVLSWLEKVGSIPATHSLGIGKLVIRRSRATTVRNYMNL